jgi:hypothetical protein
MKGRPRGDIVPARPKNDAQGVVVPEQDLTIF